MFKTHSIDIPLGKMRIIADEEFLYLLGFGNGMCWEEEVGEICGNLNCVIEPGKTAPIASIEKELSLYFAGKLTVFKTPLKMIGTPFQIQVWKELQKIPFGQTCSYAEIANAVQKPLASRAVGNANGCNRLAIIIPCHRVINADGKLGGYSSGLEKKKWLLHFEGEGSS